ncbi:MAG: fibronectin type III domain-containing protein [Coriobacteriia bacterium]|jgi:fibronectin type 3 domain-containing protein|nr:fibronectin type III domain-containing protein [Coriobacteriia bacterium]
MAITWGAIVGPGSSKMRIGVDIDVLSTTATTVQHRARVYVWTRWGVSDSSNSCSTSGAAASSGSVSISTSVSSGAGWSTSNQQLIRTVTWSSTRRYPHAGGAFTTTLSAALSGIDAVGSSLTATASQSATVPARAYSTPSAPSSVTDTRVSDTRNNVAWTRNHTDAGYYTTLYVERQANGGAYVQIAKLAGTATSYADTTTGANNSYRYRVRAYNTAGYSAYGTSGTTYNTPSAPIAVSAAKTAEKRVRVSWTNTANTETATEVSRSADGGQSWTTIATTGADATEHIDADAPGGTLVYRARNTRGALVSAWSAVSNSVTTIQPPAAPTLNVKPPASVSTAADAVMIGWVHNSLDSSAQTAAEVRVVVNGGSPATTQITGSAATHEIDVSGLDDDDTCTVSVRTRGAHADFGPYSALYSFDLFDPPAVVITSPAADDESVTSAPVPVVWDYDGHAIATYVLSVYEGDALRHRRTGSSVETCELGADTFLPRDGRSYRIELSATDVNGLAAAATRTFTVAYDLPASPSLLFDVDERSASVQLQVFAGFDESAPETVSLSVVRVDSETESTALADSLEPGAIVTDRFPLLNVETMYRVLAHAASGVAAVTDVEIVVPSGHNHFSFGDGSARLAANLSFGTAADVEAEHYAFAGRTWPVLFTGRGRDARPACSGDLYRDPDGEADFEALMLWGGPVVYRDIRGRRLDVSAKVRMSESAGPDRIVRVDVEMRRIEP